MLDVYDRLILVHMPRTMETRVLRQAGDRPDAAK